MSNKLKIAAAKFKALPRAVRWGTYVTGGYLSYAMLLGLVVPYAAEQQAPEQLTKLIERPVTLGEVKINPFTLQFEIDNFAILEGDKPFVRFDKAGLQLNFWQSIFNGALDIEYLTLDKPYVDIERLNNPDSTELAFNFSDILSAVERNTTSSPETTPEPQVDRNTPLFPVQIKRTSLNQGEIRFKDNVTGAELNYPNINFAVGQFATRSLISDNTNHYTLQIIDADSAKIDLQGQVQLKPLQVSGDVNIQQVQLPRLWEFIADDMKVKLTSGSVNLASNYRIVQTIADTADKDTLSIATEHGQFALNNLDIQANNKSIVSLPSLTVNGIATNVDQQTVTIKSVKSNGLKLATKIDQQGADLETLFTPKSSKQPLAADNKPNPTNQQTVKSNSDDVSSASQSWKLTLDGVEVKDYQIAVTENLLTPKSNTWTLAPINLITSQIVSDLSKPIDFDFSTDINGKGGIQLQGQADALKQTVSANVDVKSLKLAQFQPYLATAVKATITNGELNTQAKVNADTSGNVKVNGAIQVNHLAVRDNKFKKTFVKWRSLAVNKFNFDLAKSKLSLDTLSISEPYARVVINKDRSTNIGDLLVEQANNQQPTQSKTDNNSAKSASPFSLSVNKIAFNDGSAFFADNSLTPSFSSGIEQLKGQIKQVSSVPGTKASVDISGNIDRYAPVKIKGEINPLIAQPYLDLDVLFKSVELTTVNPYSGTYAGYFIDKGQLTLALNYQLENNQLKGSNHVVIDQLQLGKASESDLATQLPVKLAIALLQDNDGVIDLGVDVSGDVNDPAFSIGSVIWQAVSNIVTKAVTSPFNFIAGLAQSDEQLNSVAFAYGSAVLDEHQQEKLHSVGEGLLSRPNLTLSVDGSIDAVQDSQALALTQFKQILATQAQLTPAQLPSDLTASTMPISGPLSDALLNLYQDEFKQDPDTIRDKIEAELSAKNSDVSDEEIDRRWHIALYNLVLNNQKVDQDELGHLAQERAQAVKAYLVDTVKVDASQVFLLDSRFDIEQDSSDVSLALKAK